MHTHTTMNVKKQVKALKIKFNIYFTASATIQFEKIAVEKREKMELYIMTHGRLSMKLLDKNKMTTFFNFTNTNIYCLLKCSPLK